MPPPDTAPPATLAPAPGLWPDVRAARRPRLLRPPRLPPGAAAGRPRSDWSAVPPARPPHARTAPGASPRSAAASPPADVPGPWPLPTHPFERAASFSASLASAPVPVYLRSLLTGVTPCQAAVLAALRRFFNWAADTERIARNPAQHLTDVAAQPLAPKGFSDVDRRRLVRESEKADAIVMLLLNTGLR